MKYVSYQANGSDCGFVALKMLLAILSENRNYLDLAKPEDKLGSFSFKELIDIASMYGVTLKGYKDEEKFIGHTMKLPCIVILNSGDNRYKNHAVTIYKVDEKSVYYLDPKEGDEKMSISEFNEIYTGNILEVEKNNIIKYKAKRERYIARSSWFGLHLASIISVFTLLLGSLFIEEETYPFFPLLFIVLFAIGVFLEKWSMLKMMKQFDNKYFETYIGYGRRHEREKRLRQYLDFKNLYFLIPYSEISELAIITAIMFILIMNHLVNAIAIVIVIVLVFIDYLTKKSKKAKDIEKEEKELFVEIDNESEYAFEMHHLMDRSNKFALDLSFNEVMIKFAIAILSFGLMLYLKEFNANFVIFHFFMLSLIYDHLNKMVDANDKREDYQKAKARFDEIILVNKKKDGML